MRVATSVLVFLGVAGPAAAQQAQAAMPAGSAGCWPVATREQVVITRNDGSQQRGTLLCIGDGVLKGAAVGLTRGLRRWRGEYDSDEVTQDSKRKTQTPSRVRRFLTVFEF